MLIISALLNTNIDKPKLIYVGDPMCSWCYGVSEELNQVKSKYDGILDWEIIMGGLRPYNKQTMIELKDFLTEHWEHVHEASDLPFNYNVLNDTQRPYDTEPPSRALVVVRDMDESKAQDFFVELQRAFYQQNKDLSLAPSYIEALECFNLDAQEFTQKFTSSEYKEKVRLDFKKSSELGVRGFPTLLLQKDGKTHVVANGYAKSTDMIAKIEKILKH